MQQSSSTDEERRVQFLVDVESTESAEEECGWKWWCGLVLIFALIIGVATCLFFLIVPSKDAITVCISVVTLLVCVVVAWNIGTRASRVQ